MKRFLIILFTVCCPLITAYAQQKEILQVAATVRTMQCDFVQTKHLRLLNSAMVSEGRMYYQQSNRLRWEYTAPYTYTFILNGQKVLLKNSRRQDVVDTSQNKLFREIARMMMSSVTGQNLADSKDFHTTFTTKPQEYVATLVPKRKDMRQMFQQIILHISRSQKMVTQVEMIEKKGDRTVIQLKNIKLNATIPPAVFALD
jgi:outer membrane lipoprotein carrier protein